MADVLRRLSGPALLTAAAATVYTVPAATTTVLRSLRVVNETAAAASFTLSLGVDGAGKRVFYAQQVTPGDAFDWSGSLVLAAGEVVQAYASTAAALTLTTNGVESS